MIVSQNARHLGHRIILHTVFPRGFKTNATALQSPICEANATASVMYIASILRSCNGYGDGGHQAIQRCKVAATLRGIADCFATNWGLRDSYTCDTRSRCRWYRDNLVDNLCTRAAVAVVRRSVSNKTVNSDVHFIDSRSGVCDLVIDEVKRQRGFDNTALKADSRAQALQNCYDVRVHKRCSRRHKRV